MPPRMGLKSWLRKIWKMPKRVMVHKIKKMDIALIGPCSRSWRTKTLFWFERMKNHVERIMIPV